MFVRQWEVPARVAKASLLAPVSDSNYRPAEEDLERDHIRAVLDRFGWRINGRGNAAETLGLTPAPSARG